jgi:hypothetical protein
MTPCSVVNTNVSEEPLSPSSEYKTLSPEVGGTCSVYIQKIKLFTPED